MKLWKVLLIGLLAIASVTLGRPTQTQTQIQSETEGTVFVIGAVRTPGAYPLMDAATRLNALRSSGGLQPDANSTAVVIVRPANADTPNAKDEEFTVDLLEVLTGKRLDFQLKTHDVVYIPTHQRRER